MTLNLAKYRHVIWDWNGTLLDDSSLCVEILNQILISRNMPATTIQQYQDLFDFPVKNYYSKLGFDFSVEPFDIVANEYITIYNKRRFECKLQKAAIDALHFFQKNNFKQSILSAYQQNLLIEAISFFGLRNFFTKLVGLNDFYANSKVENGKSLIKTIYTDISKILLIGDTVHDFEAAKAIGIDCLLIPSGHNSKQRLKDCGTYLLNSLEDILKLL